MPPKQPSDRGAQRHLSLACGLVDTAQSAFLSTSWCSVDSSSWDFLQIGGIAFSDALKIMSAMSLEPPMYLSSLQNNIRARPIPWEGAVRAGNITDEQLKKIKAVDKVRKEQRRQTIERDLNGYVALLAGNGSKSVLDSASRRTDILQYILVLAADLINGAQNVLFKDI